MSDLDTDDIDFGISELLHELRRKHGHAPGYQKTWALVAGGIIPARRRGNMWVIRRRDLPAVEAILGLTDSDRGAA